MPFFFYVLLALLWYAWLIYSFHLWQFPIGSLAWQHAAKHISMTISRTGSSIAYWFYSYHTSTYNEYTDIYCMLRIMINNISQQFVATTKSTISFTNVLQNLTLTHYSKYSTWHLFTNVFCHNDWMEYTPASRVV